MKTESGLLQGVADENVIVYKGIPFAAPPLGERHWKAPQPAAHWADIRKADTFLLDTYMNAKRPQSLSRGITRLPAPGKDSHASRTAKGRTPDLAADASSTRGLYTHLRRRRP